MIKNGQYYARFTLLHDIEEAGEDLEAVNGKIVELVQYNYNEDINEDYPIKIKHALIGEYEWVRRDELSISDKQFGAWLVTQRLLHSIDMTQEA